MVFLAIIRPTFRVLVASAVVYFAFLGALTFPYFQGHVIYLNRVTLTWFQDLAIPEQWGFLHNQVTPFAIETSSGNSLHAWHVLPLELYRRNEQELLNQPSGFTADVTTSLNFKLLRDDPDALLVLYLHGAAGTLGSGWRPASYRGLSAGAPDRIHVVAIDYRGFGLSYGTPSEDGLLSDALLLTDWCINTAGIPASRIVVFGQSLGTAVSISLTQHLASKSPPTLFAGMVLVAPFADVATLTATYRVGGKIPILSPIAYFPRLLAYLNTFIKDKWQSKNRIADFVRRCEMMTEPRLKYHITIIHAEDDTDIPWSHSEVVYWNAVNATSPAGITYEELEKEKSERKVQLGAGGWVMDWRTKNGVIREEIIKHGVHDRIMSYPVVSLAVLRAFNSAALV